MVFTIEDMKGKQSIRVVVVEKRKHLDEVYRVVHWMRGEEPKTPFKPLGMSFALGGMEHIILAEDSLTVDTISHEVFHVIKSMAPKDLSEEELATLQGQLTGTLVQGLVKNGCKILLR